MKTAFLSAFSLFSLGIFGTLFGSFASVLIHRWKWRESGIISGRSHCPQCKKTLWIWQLIPIFSYIFFRGKCAFCQKKIPKIYPILEISMGAVFVLMGYASMQLGYNIFSVQTFFLVFFGFITVVYIFYDALFMEIPDQAYILFLSIFLPLIIWGTSHQNPFFNAFQFKNFSDFLSDKFWGILALYTFLFLQILIPGSLFLFQKKRYKSLAELLWLYPIFPFFVVYDFFRRHFQKSPENEIIKTSENEAAEEEIPTWIGAGDLLLAIIIGATLGLFHGIIAFFLAYLIGSIFGIFFIIFQKYFTEKKEISSQIPFGPFLWIGSLLAIIFYTEILSWKNSYFEIFFL